MKVKKLVEIEKQIRVKLENGEEYINDEAWLEYEGAMIETRKISSKIKEIAGNSSKILESIWNSDNFSIFVEVFEYAKDKKWLDTEAELELLDPGDIIHVTKKLLTEKTKTLTEFTSRDWIVLKNRLVKHARNINKDEPSVRAYRELGFFKLSQSPATNSLSHAIGKPAQLDIEGNGTIIDERITIVIDKYLDLTHGVRESAVKLLDRFMVEKTETRSFDTSLTEIPLKEYMDNRGLRDEKEARSQIKEDLDALNKITIKLFRDKRNGDWLDIKVCNGTKGIRNGVIYFGFNEQFLQMLNYSVAGTSKQIFGYIPVDAFKTESRYYPHAYYFIRRIVVHKRTNRGKENEDIISIKVLMDSSPTLRKYEELEKYNKRVTEYLINPIEKNLDHLSDKISAFKWEWIGDPPATYQELINARIKTYWSEYPSFQSVIDKGSKYAKLKEKAKEKAIKDKLYKQYMNKEDI